MSDLQFDLSAASWRHDARDESAFLEALAQRLDKSLPGLVKIERERKLFSRQHPVVGLEVTLGESSYQLVKEGVSLSAKRAKVVRGIVLSTKVLPFKEWLADLSASLDAYAREHEDARQALEDFLL